MADNRRNAALAGAGFACGAVASAYLFAIRPWHLRWGATDDEVKQKLPGDNLVPHPKLAATHAVTIQASPAEVWPWLVQMGQNRGGFYSYDWLENLMGLNIHSANRVVPELQHLKSGDVVAVVPGGTGPRVAVLEAGRALVLHAAEKEYACSWAFILETSDSSATRLIERFRLRYRPTLPNMLFYRLVLEPGSFLLERKMILGIKQRVEAVVRVGAPAVSPA
jgi:hypothetical protein